MTSLTLTFLTSLVLNWGLCQQGHTCNTRVPANCTFSDTFCGWQEDGWHLSVNHTTIYADNSTKLLATLQSELACSTNSHTHCLRFQFYAFYHNASTSALEVIIHQQKGDVNTPVWKVVASSNLSEWYTAAVPITTKSDFRVVFTSKREVDQYPEIALRNLEYGQSSCSLRPDWAAVPSPPKTSDNSGAGGGALVSVVVGFVWVVFLVVPR